MSGELTEPRESHHLRHLGFSQPLVTAFQFVILKLLETLGVIPQTVVGLSSGEIVGTCAAGHSTKEEAIKIAFYSGRATVLCQPKAGQGLGMLAVGTAQMKFRNISKLL